MSPSLSQWRKYRSPRRQSISRSLTRNDAAIIRTRLCIQPVERSSRMPASTIGYPVMPLVQRVKSRSASSPVVHTIRSYPGRRAFRSISRFSAVVWAYQSRQASCLTNAAAPGRSVPTNSTRCTGEIVPKRSAVERREVPAMAGRSRVSGYDSISWSKDSRLSVIGVESLVPGGIPAPVAVAIRADPGTAAGRVC